MSQSRQLAAIMFTDIVGYTKLMGKDSAKALELIQLSKEIQKPLVEMHRGQWLKEMGDGVLVKFPTATDAVNCAIEIQRAARADFGYKLRIGIHLGDITLEQGDIYGDGVNVASRLEAIADPGGIYISESIEKAIRGQISVELHDLGELQLKNVDYGVRAFAVQGVGLPDPGSKGNCKPLVTSAGNGVIKWAAYMATGLLLLSWATYFILSSYGGQNQNPERVSTHVQISLPEDVYLAVETKCPVLDIAPDGSAIVFVGVKSGKRQLFLRKLDDPITQILEGTEDSVYPFFSTDGNWIGFFKGATLMKMSISGGVPIEVHQVTPTSVNRGITWYKEDSLIITPSPDGGLDIGTASGDEIRPLTDWRHLLTSDSINPGNKPYYWPKTIPEIESVLITEFNSSRSEDQNILLYSLKEKSARTLINGGSFAEFFDNHLFFIRNESLFTVSFDPKNGNPGGPEKLLLQSLYTNTNGSSLYAVGGKNLVYVTGQTGSDQLVWVDAEGNTQLILETGNDFLYPRISPSGDRVAITSFDGPNSDLWLLELGRNALSRLTDHPGEDFGPVWHPDGQQLAFSSEIAQTDSIEEGPGIAVLNLNKNDPAKRYLPSPSSGFWEFPLSWSSDGKWLLFASTYGNPKHNLELMNIEDEQRIVWAQSKYSEGAGTFSPDARWIAYVTDFSGRNEVYVKSFGSNGPPTQVSTEGGTEPVWSPDGTELYYREYDKLVSVPVTNSSPLKLGQPKILFEKSFKMNEYGGNQANYDISPDGSRFLMIRNTSESKPRVVNVILNWDKL